MARGQKLDRREPSEVIEHHRPQLVGQVPQLLLGLIEELLALLDLRLGRGHLARHLRELQVHRHQQLARIVVQRVRDAPDLLLERLVDVPPGDERIAVAAMSHFERRQRFGEKSRRRVDERRAITAPIRRGDDRPQGLAVQAHQLGKDRKSTRLNSSHLVISYAVFCLKKKMQALTVSCPDPLYVPLPHPEQRITQSETQPFAYYSSVTV